jgi:hypothetical protein
MAGSFCDELFRACEQVRSKPMGLLADPQNPACGDAVNLLRITAAAIDPASTSACPKASPCDGT